MVVTIISAPEACNCAHVCANTMCVYEGLLIPHIASVTFYYYCIVYFYRKNVLLTKQ